MARWAIAADDAAAGSPLCAHAGGQDLPMYRAMALDRANPSSRGRSLFDDVAAAATGLGREMRICAAPMLADSPSIREFATALGVDKSLAWQVHQIATASDPVAILIALPGQAGIAKAMRALQSAGRDTAAVEAARAALIYVLNRRGISRAQLKAMATGQPDGPIETAALRLLHRRAYEANSAIQGRSIGGLAVAVLLMPVEPAGALTLVAATMLHRMARTLASGPIPIYYRTQAAGSHASTPRTSGGTRKGSMASLVRPLCSPEVEDAHISLIDFQSGEALCYDPPPSHINRVDFAFREIGHGVATMDRTQTPTEGMTDVALFNPTEHAVIDFMPHRSLPVEDPGASLMLRNAPDIVCKSAPEFLQHPMPIDAGWTTRRRLPATFVTAADRWEALVEDSVQAVNASAADFRTYRIQIKHPPTPSSVCVRWTWSAGGTR